MKPETSKVLGDIAGERLRQDIKWGQQNHEYPMWSAILAEEIGEVAKAWLWWKIEKVRLDNGLMSSGADYREEMVQSAAVLVNMIECYDRNEGVSDG